MKHRLKKQRKPVARKVTAATAAAALVTVLVYVARGLGFDVPEELADALVILALFAGGWLRTER